MPKGVQGSRLPIDGMDLHERINYRCRDAMAKFRRGGHASRKAVVKHNASTTFHHIEWYTHHHKIIAEQVDFGYQGKHRMHAT